MVTDSSRIPPASSAGVQICRVLERQKKAIIAVKFRNDYY